MVLVGQHPMSYLRWSEKTRSRMSSKRWASSILIEHKRTSHFKDVELKRQYRELIIIVSM